MQMKFIGAADLPCDRQLIWAYYSEKMQSFICGDDKRAFSIALSRPSAPVEVTAAFSESHPCNLPIPSEMYEEFAERPWHGLKFLNRAAYDCAIDARGQSVGDLLRTLVFGPDYGHYVLHPPSGLIFSLRSGSIEMLRQESGGFVSVARTKTRGKAALAFAGHPELNVLAYGDNFGTFHLQRFDMTGFGKASKIVALDRKASRLEWIEGGRILAIGGMGYLETYSFDSDKFSLINKVESPVRDFVWVAEKQLVMVNQGMHGIAAYRYDSNGFAKIASVQAGCVQQIAVAAGATHVLATDQESSRVSIFETAD